jgi:hypothetical protein
MSSSARLSLGLIADGNEFGRLDKDDNDQLSELQRKSFDPPHETTTRICVIKGSTSVMSSFNAENRKHSRGHDEQSRVDKVPRRANTLSKPKNRCQCSVVPQCPIRIQKSLRLEDLGLRIYIRVMCDRPAEDEKTPQRQ